MRNKNTKHQIWLKIQRRYTYTRNYVFLLFLLFYIEGKTQDFYDINGDIVWSTIHETGILMVGATNGLYTIDPVDGSSQLIASANPIKLENLEIISETPYLIAKRQVIEKLDGGKKSGMSNSKLGKFVMKQAGGKSASSSDTVMTFSLIDLFEGKILFDAYEQGYKNRSRSLLAPELNGYFFVAKKEKEQRAVFVDLDSGEEKWSYALPNRSIRDLISRSLLQPIATPNGDIVLPYGKEIYVLNATNGNLKWMKEYPSINDIVPMNKGEAFALIDAKGISNTKSEIIAIKASDGEELWQKPYKNKGAYAFALPLDEGLFFITYNAGNGAESQFLDYKTGNALWSASSRPISVAPYAGAPDFLTKRDQEIIMIVKGNKQSVGGGAANSIEYFKTDGSSNWKKGAIISDELYYFNILDDGILYVDDKEANIIAKSDGKPIFKKIIDLKKGTILTLEHKSANKLIIYNENTLYELDTKSGEYRTLMTGSDIKKKEDFSSIQLLENGYLLSAIRTALYVDFEGNEIYRKDFEDPYEGNNAGSLFKSLGLSLAGMVLASTVTMGKVGFLGTSEGQKYISNDLRGESHKNATYDAVASKADASVANVFKAQNNVDEARRRTREQRRKSLTVENSLVFVGKGQESVASLIQLAPESGEIIQAISLDNASPYFKVDNVNKVIYYYRSDGIQTFPLK